MWTLFKVMASLNAQTAEQWQTLYVVLPWSQLVKIAPGLSLHC